MNYMLIPTLLIASILFAVGMRIDRRSKRFVFLSLFALGVVIAIPGILFAVYYLKFLGEPIALYQFRSLPLSELSASGAGLLAGLLHGRFAASARFRRTAGAWFFPGILALGLIVPYLKPIVRPPNWKQFQDRWSDNVCLQTSESSCGPACAATLLRRLGKTGVEQEIARASFTSRGGTENWYLARALRQRGVGVQFMFEPEVNKPWPFPAMAGVRLSGLGNVGHFITVLDRIDDKYVVGDPLEGRSVKSQAELQETYEFTGFFMIVN